MRTFFSFASVFLLFMVTACNIDHGLGVMTTKIQGRIILPNMAMRPDYLESVRIIATTKNLADLQDGELSLSDVIFSNTSVDLGQQTPSYSLAAPHGTYKLVAAVWKKRGEAWDYTRFFGFHGFDPETFTFSGEPVILDKENPIASDIDIYCDWAFVNP